MRIPRLHISFTGIFGLGMFNEKENVMPKSEKKLKKQLQSILQTKPGTVHATVAEEALDYHQISHFFEDLAQHGCASGMVGSLIYYVDTHAFYDKHYQEIEELRHEYEDEFGQPITTDGDWKNHMAWFAFEWVAYQMYAALIDSSD